MTSSKYPARKNPSFGVSCYITNYVFSLCLRLRFWWCNRIVKQGHQDCHDGGKNDLSHWALEFLSSYSCTSPTILILDFSSFLNAIILKCSNPKQLCWAVHQFQVYQQTLSRRLAHQKRTSGCWQRWALEGCLPLSSVTWCPLKRQRAVSCWAGPPSPSSTLWFHESRNQAHEINVWVSCAYFGINSNRKHETDACDTFSFHCEINK